jgi:hypothetical protein
MQDWQGFLKIDNATTIDFLTSYAGALSQEGEISERSLDHLKVSLASIMSKLSTSETTVLTMLRDCDSEFLELLMTRYGVTGLAWNHFRFTTRSILSESCARMATWADNALKKAELFMNRPYLSAANKQESRRELFPSVLVHAAKSLHDATRELREVILSLSVMRSADILDTSGSLHPIEERVALAVGFVGLETETLSYCRTELKAIRKIAVAFDELSMTMMQIVSGLRANTQQAEKSKALEIEMEFFCAECQRLSGTRFDMSANLDVWEARRIGFLNELFLLNQRMTSISQLFIESLAPKERFEPSALLTSDVERAITCSLVKSGAPVHNSIRASKDLINYCRSHNATPATLIAAELKKINPELRQETLELAALLTSDTVTTTPGGLAEKSRFFEFAKKIRKALNASVPFSATMSVLFLAFIVNSCGVKTNIVSEIVDPRPEIPYKQNAAQPLDPEQPTKQDKK